MHCTVTVEEMLCSTMSSEEIFLCILSLKELYTILCEDHSWRCSTVLCDHREDMTVEEMFTVLC